MVKRRSFSPYKISNGKVIIPERKIIKEVKYDRDILDNSQISDLEYGSVAEKLPIEKVSKGYIKEKVKEQSGIGLNFSDPCGHELLGWNIPDRDKVERVVPRVEQL